MFKKIVGGRLPEEAAAGRIIRRVGPGGGAAAAGLSREDARSGAGPGPVAGSRRIVLDSRRKPHHGLRRPQGIRVPVRPLREAVAAQGAEEREHSLLKHPRGERVETSGRGGKDPFIIEQDALRENDNLSPAPIGSRTSGSESTSWRTNSIQFIFQIIAAVELRVEFH